MSTRYLIALPDPERTRAAGEFAFIAQGADAFARELQDALRGDGLFQRWRATQDEPDEVDPALGVIDSSATVTGTQRETRVELVADTVLPGAVFKHRMRLLAGSAWELRDVRAG
ncbi:MULTISPECIES: hypothetical protein [unclassified Luteimonas]|uniref:hypothetical protein n=1 Tax=unclassified Luteimonas TaxID=2629088 RepID=UPI0016025940|nr:MULTISPECIES: hypothetical protein [unclassified Luteimonas]MBB1473047.1 hypothetical protein [Luteimonas sp. MC1782]MBB6598252.1 hypothetical protein [Luteimonas sp. MC1825]QOC88468.1 hypothetical protein IDM46_01485 [Luteimonas sp. MC1825]